MAFALARQRVIYATGTGVDRRSPAKGDSSRKEEKAYAIANAAEEGRTKVLVNPPRIGSRR